MRVLQVARKCLRENLREAGLLALVVLTPLVFLGITAFAYNTPFLRTHPIGVLLAEGGDMGLVRALEQEQYPGGKPVFKVERFDDPAEARQAVEERELVALLEVARGDEDRPAVRVYGDALYGRFYRASVILDEVILRFADRSAGRPLLVTLTEARYAPAGPENEFDFYAPGMIVFALLMLIPQTAMLVGREIRWGTLRRLRLSRLRAWEFLLGTSLAQMAVAAILVLVVFMTALALGYHNHGSLLLAVVIGLVISLSAIGTGLLVACFIENDSQAVNLGSTVTMLQVFLCGAFFPIPALTLFTLFGHPIGLFDLVPATHGLLALQQVLNDGADLSQVLFRLSAALLLSVLYALVGVFIFQRLKMQPRNG